MNFCLLKDECQPCSHNCISCTNRIFASSLFILFSSSSLALAFLRSAMNCTNPRMFELFPELPRLRKLDPAMFDISAEKWPFWMAPFPTCYDVLYNHWPLPGTFECNDFCGFVEVLVCAWKGVQNGGARSMRKCCWSQRRCRINISLDPSSEIPGRVCRLFVYFREASRSGGW